MEHQTRRGAPQEKCKEVDETGCQRRDSGRSGARPIAQTAHARTGDLTLDKERRGGRTLQRIQRAPVCPLYSSPEEHLK